MVVIKINYENVSPVIKITYDETPIYVKTTYNNVYAKVVYGTGQGGGVYTNKYYGAFSDYTTQSAIAIDTGYAITLNTTDLSYGVSIVDNSKITFSYDGIYNLQFSAQLQNNETNSDNDVTIWLKKNGTNVVGSTGLVGVPRKTGNTDGHTIAAWNYLLNVNSGDYFQFFWSTSDIDVTLKYYPADFYPSVPSLIVTATQI